MLAGDMLSSPSSQRGTWPCNWWLCRPAGGRCGLSAGRFVAVGLLGRRGLVRAELGPGCAGSCSSRGRVRRSACSCRYTAARPLHRGPRRRLTRRRRAPGRVRARSGSSSSTTVRSSARAVGSGLAQPLPHARDQVGGTRVHQLAARPGRLAHDLALGAPDRRPPLPDGVPGGSNPARRATKPWTSHRRPRSRPRAR